MEKPLSFRLILPLIQPSRNSNNELGKHVLPSHITYNSKLQKQPWHQEQEETE